jgi:hypothetical protein
MGWSAGGGTVLRTESAAHPFLGLHPEGLSRGDAGTPPSGE